ncbi:MAG TPA: hypothetical protein VE621_19370, partial [Bryobacteraceae bacterium]|nr:hypothetical protein [Bryobacteraceae bacterium]
FEELVNNGRSFQVCQRGLRDAQREYDAALNQLRRVQKERRNREREALEEQRAKERHEATLQATAGMGEKVAEKVSKKILQHEPGLNRKSNKFSDTVLLLTDEFRPGLPPKLTPQQEEDLGLQQKPSKPDQVA